MSILREITIRAQPYLEKPEILLFIGSRQAGKTTILKQLQSQRENTFFLNLEDPDYLKLLNETPKNLFKIFTLDTQRKNFVFIDEIQYLKNPSNFLKFFYDEYKEKIKLIISGSSAFYLDTKFKDSLAGRKKIFHVRTLSFREFLKFKNEQKLSIADFHKLSMIEEEKIKIFYNEFMVYGGYPRVVLASLEEKKEILQELAYSYIKKDLYDAHIRQDEVFYKLFKILASGIGQLTNATELASTLGVSKTLINNYLTVMQKSFHVSLVRPFFKNIRKELTKMPKAFFQDTGLRNFFMNNFESFDVRFDKGMLLENAVFRQLIEEYDEQEIKFWRTISGDEIDFIIEGKKAIEVKVNNKKFHSVKYQRFSENYPEIKLENISVENVWKL